MQCSSVWVCVGHRQSKEGAGRSVSVAGTNTAAARTACERCELEEGAGVNRQEKVRQLLDGAVLGRGGRRGEVGRAAITNHGVRHRVRSWVANGGGQTGRGLGAGYQGSVPLLHPKGKVRCILYQR